MAYKRQRENRGSLSSVCLSQSRALSTASRNGLLSDKFCLATERLTDRFAFSSSVSEVESTVDISTLVGLTSQSSGGGATLLDVWSPVGSTLFCCELWLSSTLFIEYSLFSESSLFCALTAWMSDSSSVSFGGTNSCHSKIDLSLFKIMSTNFNSNGL